MTPRQVGKGDDTDPLYTPPDCLYLADPNRLSVLGITIVAQASAPCPICHAPQTPSQDAAGTPLSSSMGYRRADHSSPPPPPSAFNNPLRAWQHPPSSSRSQASRHRPKSVEIGTRAKDALRDFKDLGKGVAQGWRNSSKVDLHSSLEEDRAKQEGATADSSSHNKSFMAFRQVYSLRPRIEPLAGETAFQEMQHPSSVDLHMTSELQYGTSDIPHLDEDEACWKTLREVPVEYVAEDGAITKSEISRAGFFESIRSDAPSAEDERREVLQAMTPRTGVSGGYRDDALGTRHVMLKVSPPVWCLERVPSASAHPIASHITVNIHLRIRPSSISPSATFKRTSPAGPRAPQSHARSTVVFASASTLSKLVAAVQSSGWQRDGGRSLGPLASTEAARLEGIECVSVHQGTAAGSPRIIDFSWTWKNPSRGGKSNRDALADGSADCVCAFIELEEGRDARVLASFCFKVSLSAPCNGERFSLGEVSPLHHSKYDNCSSRADPEQTTNQLFSRWHNSTPPSSPTRSSGLNKGVGLGLHDIVSTPLPGSSIGQAGNLVADNQLIGVRERKRSLDATAARGSCDGQVLPRPLGPQMNSPSKDPFADINFIEIDLAEVEEDGPILRAALQNLEKRSLGLKKAAKTTIKAAVDVREKLSHLQASQEALESSIQGLAQLMPSTVGHLDDTLLLSERRKAHSLREQEREMLQMHVEQPLQLVVEQCKAVLEELKVFEAESKVYYLGTQKWLAGKGASSKRNSSSTSGREPHDVYSPSAVGFDKSSLRQESIDDRQRLRQARFQLARLDIYQAVSRLHGGELELKLATNFLMLSKWQCTEEQSQSDLQSFDAGLQVEQEAVRERNDAIRRKQREVEQQYLKLQELVRISVGDGDGDAVNLASSEGETVIGAAKRQAGVKIKSFLSTFSHSRVSQNIIASPSVDRDSQGAQLHLNVSPSKPIGHCSPMLSLSPQQATTSRLVPSVGPAMSPSHGHIHAPQTPGHVQERSVSDSTAYSPRPRGYPSDDLSPRPRRTMSVTVPPLSPALKVYQTLYVHDTSPEADVRLEQSCGTKHSEGKLARDQASCEDSKQHSEVVAYSKRHSLLQPRCAAVQQGRKKEGILWAMSKPIAGSVGADAPKAVSRAQNWKECWVVLSGSGHLGQYVEWRDVKGLEMSQPLIDLRFATVRPARNVERRFTFEVVTRECRRFFQASNDEEMKEWIAAISLAIESLLNGTSSIRQTEKVARAVGAVGSGANTSIVPGDDFGPKPATSYDIVKQRDFSQSLTDLSSAKSNGPARLFMRSAGMAKEEVSRKRQSKGSHSFPSGHALTHSEGAEPSLSLSGLSSAPICSSAWKRHERGISNKTPTSGYLAQTESNHAPFYTLSPQQLEFDRKIEEMVQTHFGGVRSSAHQRKESTRSVSDHRIEPSQVDHGTGLVGSNKYTRSKEIIEIANEVENRECADCKSRDPRWASWSLNGEPRCIFICISCSGVHRSLGVSISKVKSVDLDDWTEEQLESARRWGNKKVNEEYEARRPFDATVENLERQFWVRKYVDRAWYETMRREEQCEERRADNEGADDFNYHSDAELSSLSRSVSPPIDEKWDGKWSSLHSAMTTGSDDEKFQGYKTSSSLAKSKKISLQSDGIDANSTLVSDNDKLRSSSHEFTLPHSPSLKSSKRFGRYSIGQQISPTRPAAAVVA